MDDDEQARFEAVLSGAQQLQRVVRRTAWEATPPAWRENARVQFDVIAASAEAHTAAGDPSVEFPVNWGQIEAALGSLAPFVPALLPEESVAEDAASFRRSAGQLVRGLRADVEEARAETGRVRSELAEVEAQRDAALQAIREQQTALQGTINEQASRLDEAIRQNQAQFSESQEQHRRQVTELLAEQRTALDAAVGDAGARTANAVESAETEASEALDRIAAMEAKALQSYNTIGNAAVAGHYQSDANKQAKQANLWRWFAVGAFLLIGIGTIIELAASGGSLGWDQTRSRLPVILGLGAFAGFAVAEARSHRKAERASRRREVELSSLDPFLALIENHEAAEKVKIDYARRVFVDQPAEDLPPDAEPEPA